MKLPQLNKDKNVWLREFDKWVTPFLEEVRDSAIYHTTVSRIKSAIELLGLTNDVFKSKDSASPEILATALMNGINGKTGDETFSLVISFCDLLFLVTGKTDNNNKCQFPVFLREKLKKKVYPSIRGTKLGEVSIPRVITCEGLAKLISQLQALYNVIGEGKELNLQQMKSLAQIQQVQKETAFNYFEFILNQPIYARSLQVFGAQYFELKKIKAEDDLLAPMVISYVRGSASASGGHKPESILRDNMYSWGLRPNEDYNVNDVLPYEIEKNDKGKKRAFDFVLPYNIKDWEYKIFIQSQFYAGDSGSVSHKNVDQTSTSRKSVREKFKNPLFVEYVDGAGYYGSLNGDLKRILSMEDTENFIQIRTFSIKLRQVLQSTGFLTPLELVHALVSTNGSLENAKGKLKVDGYSDSEITRIIRKVNDLGIVKLDKDQVIIEPDFYVKSRQYFLLDAIAIHGMTFDVNTKEMNIYYVPGYQEFHGIRISDALAKVKNIAGAYYQDWADPITFSQDLEFLVEQRWVEIHNSDK